MNKRFMFSFLFASLFLSQASFAGWKEAGGDDSLVFKCENGAVVVSGYQSIYEGLMEVFVRSNGKVIGEDMGMLTETQFEGDRLTLAFSEGQAIVVSSSMKTLSVETFNCAFSPEYKF